MGGKLEQGIGSLDPYELKYLGRRLKAVPSLEKFKVLFPAEHEALRARRRYQLTTILDFSEQALRANEDVKTDLGGLIHEITKLVREVKRDSALLDLGYNAAEVFAKIEVDSNDRKPRPLEEKKMMLLCIALIDTIIGNETLADRIREISSISGISGKSLKYNQIQMQNSPNENLDKNGSTRNRRYSTAEYNFYQEILDLTGYYEDGETKRARRHWLQDYTRGIRGS